MADEQVPVETIETRDWTRQNLHVHVDASGEQYRFVMPGAALTEDEFRRLEEKVLAIEAGSLLVISGSLPPGISVEHLTQLVKTRSSTGYVASSTAPAMRWPPRWMSATSSWSNRTRKSLARWYSATSASLTTCVMPRWN